MGPMAQSDGTLKHIRNAAVIVRSKSIRVWLLLLQLRWCATIMTRTPIGVRKRFAVVSTVMSAAGAIRMIWRRSVAIKVKIAWMLLGMIESAAFLPLFRSGSGCIGVRRSEGKVGATIMVVTVTAASIVVRRQLLLLVVTAVVSWCCLWWWWIKIVVHVMLMLMMILVVVVYAIVLVVTILLLLRTSKRRAIQLL